ncbi:MAG: magnesium/cobalt transporter CorA [Thermodesulfobacteriota bacterium]
MEGTVDSLSPKITQPPGTLRHATPPRQQATTISVITYDADRCEQATRVNLDQVAALKAAPGRKWFRVQGLGDIPVLQSLGEIFGVHRLAMEDVLNSYQRPKLEDFDDYLFLVCKAVGAGEEDGSLRIRQVSLVLGREFILSFEEEASDLFDSLPTRLANGRGRIRQLEVDYLAYAMLDVMVDNYFLVLETLGDQTEEIEESVMTQPTRDTLQELYRQKRLGLHLRRALMPLREISAALLREDPQLISEGIAPYLRDLHDHVIQAIDILEGLRENLSALSDLYLSSINNRMNEVMKLLTIIATIFIPITFIASLYGMNFKHMPELELTWAYPAVLALMAVVAGGLVVFFKTRRWM